MKRPKRAYTRSHRRAVADSPTCVYSPRAPLGITSVLLGYRCAYDKLKLDVTLISSSVSANGRKLITHAHVLSERISSLTHAASLSLSQS